MPIIDLAIHGKASGLTKELSILDHDLNKNMLTYLQDKGFAIASSCSGRGICQKCIVNDNILLCQYSVKEFIENFGQDISVDYL